MGEKNNKILLVAMIIILVIIAVVFVVILINKDKKQSPQQAPIQQETKEINEPKRKIIPLTEEKREELAVIKNIVGTIISVDIAMIKVSTPEGELELKIPQQGASFVTQSKQEDDSFLIENIGLLDIPIDKEVAIQYNSKSSEVMLVTVK